MGPTKGLADVLRGLVDLVPVLAWLVVVLTAVSGIAATAPQTDSVLPSPVMSPRRKPGRPSARAASHSVWIASTTEWSRVCGMVAAPSPAPADVASSQKTAMISGASPSPCSFSAR